MPGRRSRLFVVTDENEWTRLARYLAGECTPQEAEEIRRWLEADPERQRLAEELKPAWDAATTSSTNWDTPASWQRLAARVRARERRADVALVQPEGRDRWPRRRSWWPPAVAAAAIVAITVGGLLWRVGHQSSTSATSVHALREVRTAAMQRATVRLADGSRVVLAPSSVLRYDPARFGLSTRELHLEGRAYFEVTHDPRRPFFVRTARTITEDLGTEFIITDYPDRLPTEVAVASGTVAVRSAISTVDATPATVLGASERVQLDSAGRPNVQRGIDVASQLAWTEGRLVFADTPVSEAIAELSYWYGLDIRVHDASLASQRFTASYTTQSESVVLRELAVAIGAQVERHGGVITLVRASSPS